jgi:hypothetical protein
MTNGSDADIIEPNPGESSMFSILCRGPGGSVEKRIRLTTTPVTATVALLATQPLIRSGNTTQLRWDITTDYPLNCTLTGAGTNAPFTVGTIGTHNGLILTEPVANTTDFTLSCMPQGYPGPLVIPLGTARVEVVPINEER